MEGLLDRIGEASIAQMSSNRSVERLLKFEAVLYLGLSPCKPVGLLWITRRSNGLCSFTLALEPVFEEHNGIARLYRDAILVARFDFAGRSLAFRWQGKLTDQMLGFDAGQHVRLEVAGLQVTGTIACR